MLRDMEKQGYRFSYTTDEWSSKANRRYSSVNVHPPGVNPIRLGMVHIKDCFTAEKAVELFTEKIGEFDLKVDKQFGISTDGCSVMEKMGKQLDLAGRNWQGTFQKCLSNC